MPETGVVPCFRVNVAVVIVAGSIASLKATETFRLMGTATAVLVGDVTLTVGAVVSAIFGISFALSAHPATKATSSNTINHIFGYPLHLFIFVPSLRTFKL